MRKIILFSAVSIDGFIAGEGDDLDWLMTFGPSDVEAQEDYDAFYQTIDTAMMGNGTYRYVLGEGIENPYPDKESFVFTREKKEDTEAVKYISGDLAEFVEKERVKDGKDIWLVGGGAINALFLNSNLIDEMWLDIIPVTIGKGTRLFDGDGCFQLFEVEETKVSPVGRISVKYVRVAQ